MTTQEIVGRWAESTFPQSTEWSVVCHLRREVDELMDAIATGHQPSVEEETADCLLLLYHLSHKCGFDLHDAGAAKFAQIKTRTWGQSDSDGVVEHIR